MSSTNSFDNNEPSSLKDERDLHEGSSHSEENYLTQEVSRVHVVGEGGEFVILDNKKYYKHELMSAFGGTFNPGLKPASTRNFGNASALGLMGFSVSCFLLCMLKTEARHVVIPNILVGVAFFFGGLVEFLAGCWEIGNGNTFAGTAFASFGPFWMSFASIYIKWYGISTAYEDPVEFGNAVGFYLVGWDIFILMCLICCVRSTWPFFGLFFFLEITFILLTIASFNGSLGVQKAGGVVGLLTAFFGFYNAFAGIADERNSYVKIRPMYLPGAVKL